MNDIQPSSPYRKAAERIADNFVREFARGGRRMEELRSELSGTIETQMSIAAADATRAERNRHVPLLNSAEELCNLVDGYSGLGADAERAVERTRAAIRSAEPDAGDAEKGEG